MADWKFASGEVVIYTNPDGECVHPLHGEHKVTVEDVERWRQEAYDEVIKDWRRGLIHPVIERRGSN